MIRLSHQVNLLLDFVDSLHVLPSMEHSHNAALILTEMVTQTQQSFSLYDTEPARSASFQE